MFTLRMALIFLEDAVYIVLAKVQRADLTCHVIRNSLRLCCVDQSGTSIQILPEPRDTFFFYKITTLAKTGLIIDFQIILFKYSEKEIKI